MLLDINFHFGTLNNSSEETSYFITIAVPVLIAVLTVMITLLFQRLYDNFKKNENLDDLYRHIKEQVIILNSAATKYSDNLAALSADMGKKEVENFSFAPVANFDVDLVLDWKTSDFYHSVVSRRFNTDKDKTDLMLTISDYTPPPISE